MSFIKNVFLLATFLIFFSGYSSAQSVFNIMNEDNDLPEAEQVNSEDNDLPETEQKAEPVRVFLDPGHGGSDLGAMGEKFILEKNITLNIAKDIKRSLAEDERIEVISSRFDDTEISVIERINMANKSGAVLYLGIHADGAIVPRRHSVKVFISKSREENKNDVSPDEWAAINQKYFDESKSLAEEAVEEFNILNPARGIDIVMSDKLLLGGLAMPAMIVEPLDLSNPEDELELDDPRYLNSIASALGRAITGFLEKSGAVKIRNELE